MRVLACVVLVGVLGCRGDKAGSPAAVTRLVDLQPSVTGGLRLVAAASTPSIELRFDGKGAQPSWKAGPGIAGLQLKDGNLAGRITAAGGLLAAELPRSTDRDVVHEVRVRLRVTAGSNLSVAFRATDTVDLKEEAQLLRAINWPFTTPLLADKEMRTYVLRTTASVRMAQRYVLIRPADVAGASFEIESLRVVSRREHLATIPSGLGWQGLGEVYREAMVARAPETIRFDVELPRQPHLELAVGTIEDLPVTFRVAVKRLGDQQDTKVFERTVTTAYRWETASVDLSGFAGKKATISLALAADKPGTLGFWGTPTVRNTTPGLATSPAPQPRGVILIWADTLRRDHLSFYGYSRETAPVLHKMAAEGVVFEDTIAQASWTKASGPSILTSLYPTTHTVQSFNDVLPSSATTIAEVYRQAGYATLGLISIPFVGKFTNLHQGFEELHEPGSFPELDAGTRKSARAQVDRLLPWLEDHKDAPFFVLLHIRDPHSPFKPYPPYDTLWADPSKREAHERDAKVVQPLIQNPSMRRFGMPTREELVRARIDPEAYIAYEKDWYDGSIRAMDTEIGRLRERLSDLGLDQSTLVAFVADHGEEFLEHGRTFHQSSVYGELANVPLFLWGPGTVPSGKRVAPTVQNLDLMPTLLDLSGLSAPVGVQGTSLVPLFRGTATSWPRPAVIEAGGRQRPDPTSIQEEDAWAIVLDGYKLVHRPNPMGGRPEHELFDHRADPLDRVDVASSHPDVVARLSRELEAWRKMATAARLKPDATTTGTMKAEDLERLRALGYVQ